MGAVISTGSSRKASPRSSSFRLLARLAFSFASLPKNTKTRGCGAVISTRTFCVGLGALKPLVYRTPMRSLQDVNLQAQIKDSLFYKESLLGDLLDMIKIYLKHYIV